MPSRTCADFRELISYYLDGEASPDERAQLMAHLATCAECRRTIEAYRSIGHQMRTLPPVHPPSDLTDAIYAATVDAAPRRLFLFTSRLGYSVSAIAAVLLIFVVAAYLLVGGYQRGIDPKVTASKPQDHMTWSIFSPIEITFNKPMDHESVEAALGILPTDPENRVSITWRGNTLVIGEDQPLKPNTNYVITISTAARDKWGNRLSEEFNLQFGTTSSVALEQTPTPTLAPAPTQRSSTPTVATTSPPTPTPTERAGGTAPTPTTSIPPSAPSESPTPANGGVATSPVGDASPTPVESVATPTPTQAESPPAATPTPEPTATPTVAPEPPSPTPVPTVTPQPTTTPGPPTATPEPTDTPTPDVIAVTGAFGDLYWNDDTVRAGLGEPLAEAFNTDALDQPFQHGEGYYRADTDTIYLLNTDSFTWEHIPNTATAAPAPQPGPEPDTWIPGGIIGFHWQSEQWIQDSFGFATSEYWSAFNASVQEFEHGLMLMAPGGQVYVLYDSATWEFRSVGGS